MFAIFAIPIAAVSVVVVGIVALVLIAAFTGRKIVIRKDGVILFPKRPSP